MARYFYRDGTVHDTEFALPVNASGWYDTPRGRLYAEWKLKALQDSEFLRHARKHDQAPSALHMAKREFGDFTLNHMSLIEALEDMAYADELLARYLEAINNRLALTDFEVANAQSIIRRIRNGS